MITMSFKHRSGNNPITLTCEIFTSVCIRKLFDFDFHFIEDSAYVTLYYTLIGTTPASLFSVSICKNLTAYMSTRFVRHRLAVSLWTNCKPTAIISSSFYKLVVVNLVAICYVQAISDLLRQLIVTKSNEVVDLVIYTRCDNLFQICQTTGNKQCECIPISSRRTDMLQTCSPE